MKRINRIIVAAVTLTLLACVSSSTPTANGQTPQPSPVPDSSQRSPRPDLVPYGTSQHYGGPFCLWSAAPEGATAEFMEVNLWVFVKNEFYVANGEHHGGGDAPASTAEVAYKVYIQAGGDEYSWRSFYKSVPPLKAGERTLGNSGATIFKVPKSCFGPSGRCEFKFTVDYGNKVRETHENNNIVYASCRRTY